MDHHKQQSGSGFINGLLLGLVIGVGIAVLLTTKKGKRILKAITEEGLDSINSLDDLYERIEKILKDDEKAAVSEPVSSPKILAAIVPVETAPEPVIIPQPEVVQPTQQVIIAQAITRPLPPVEEEQTSESYEEPEVKKTLVISVDAETSSKFAEVQQRLDEEIESVSEKLAQKFVAYADDDLPGAIEEEEVAPPKVKQTRRRFFRGIQRRA